jgi:long-chain acyl-CoA synthetase
MTTSGDVQGEAEPVGADEGREQRNGQLAQGMAIAYWAGTHPDRSAIVSGLGNRTYSQLNGRANQLVRALRRRGVGRGDAVAIMCRNRPEFAEVYGAALRAGWRLTPVNFHLTGGEAAYIVADCGAKAFVADADLGPRVAGVARPLVRLAVGLSAAAVDGWESYEGALAAEDPTDIDDPSPGYAMLYTSGTTGRPKGVYRDPPELVIADVSAYSRQSDCVHLCTGPMYHAAPLAISLHNPLSAGATVVAMDGWDAEETLRLIEAHGVTHSHMVATMFHRLLSLPAETRSGYDLSSLRWVVHGAAPCPVHVKHAVMEWWGPIVHEYYAATEGVGTVVDAVTWLTKPGTVGKVVPDDHIVIGDEDGNALASDEIGLVWLKAPPTGRFIYLGDEAKTSTSYRDDYFTLGDVGYVDEDGYLFLTDRSTNLIISGGVNIYPAEVDAVLLDHPAVGDVATIGVPNEEWGEEVRAVVEVRAGVVPSETLANELVTWCRERLAAFKCPRSVDFVDELPRQDNGKIYKRVLRDRYRA